MFELKPLSRDGIDAALEKAERYRLLNEPWEAQSICRDILAIDADNQQALIVLLLAITDQFQTASATAAIEAQDVLHRLHGDYERHYYAGIISERRAKTYLARGAPGAAAVAYDLLRQAMELYEKAEAARPPGNDDAQLRWNTCVRLIERHNLRAPEPEPLGTELE